MSEEHYLLMRDTPGEKTPGTFKKIVGITNQKRVLRGELLRPIPREKEARPDVVQPNYSVERDPAITLFAAEDDISPLNIDDYHLLKAIDSATDRFRVFSDPHWLEWGENLKVGNLVYVRLPSPNESAPTWSHAIVRYRGPVKNLFGMNFGVEITVSLTVDWKILFR
jgi:DNA helicase HerA-like ATPase